MRYSIPTTQEKVSQWIILIWKNWWVINKTQFSIKWVKWRYNYSDSTGILTVDITDKPRLASWSMIEEKLKEFFM